VIDAGTAGTTLPPLGAITLSPQTAGLPAGSSDREGGGEEGPGDNGGLHSSGSSGSSGTAALGGGTTGGAAGQERTAEDPISKRYTALQSQYESLLASFTHLDNDVKSFEHDALEGEEGEDGFLSSQGHELDVANAAWENDF
jgi:hypothetical protein